MKIKAEKIVEKKTKGEYETIKKHIIKVEDISEKELDDFVGDLGLVDDYEDAYYNYGIGMDFNYDLMYLNVDKFIEGLKKWQKDEEYWEESKEWIKRLKKYKKYTFNFIGDEDD